MAILQIANSVTIRSRELAQQRGARRRAGGGGLSEEGGGGGTLYQKTNVRENGPEEDQSLTVWHSWRTTCTGIHKQQEDHVYWYK